MDASHGNPITWHPDALPRVTQKALEFCAADQWFQNAPWYLAGGTSLALQVGHRKSFDLDFFTQEKDFNQQVVASHFPADHWKTENISFGTLLGELHGAKVSFIAYPLFIPRQPFVYYQSVSVLQPRDVGVMKILAMSQRGRKRDFVDLYWLCHHIDQLAWFFKQLPDQYPSVAHDYHHIIKALTYFDDAEKDEMSDLNFHADWRTIKKFFQDEAKNLARDLLGIQ
ncbi:MAG: nucleotidyl transferase AbiEii/AbiGii toxin family protein [Patescibacteria group bacterium]